jgi:YD repeat-containing protein
MASEHADRYWAQFVRSAPAGSARPRPYYEAFHFGSGADATSIAGLVVAGTKTSTASLQWVYDAEGRRREVRVRGGEGDRTMEDWRRMYWKYILSECARIEREPSRQTPLGCERFRAVYAAPLEREALARP